MQMDPQQRLLIEHCYEALSVASTGEGLSRRGTTAVYVGVASAEYLALSGHLGVTIFAATGMTRPRFLDLCCLFLCWRPRRAKACRHAEQQTLSVLRFFLAQSVSATNGQPSLCYHKWGTRRRTTRTKLLPRGESMWSQEEQCENEASLV